MESRRHEVTLFTREGCHLCEVARQILEAALERHPFDLVEIDIDTDDELVRDHGYRVPVVSVDGVERFETWVDAEELASYLGAPTPGVRHQALVMEPEGCRW